MTRLVVLGHFKEIDGAFCAGKTENDENEAGNQQKPETCCELRWGEGHRQIFLPSQVNGPPGLLFTSLPAALVLTFQTKSISL